MNAIVQIATPDTFEFEGQPIRIFRDGKNVTFAAIDLAKCAGYGAVGEMTRLLKPKHKGVQIVHTLGGRQQIGTVTEAGLYRILTQRRGSDRTPADVMERIERFQDWVFEDVLPSIRKTGSYSLVPAQPPQAIAIANLFRDPSQLLALAAFHAQAAITARAEVEAEKIAHSETHQFLEDQVRLTEIESRRAENNGHALVVASRTIEEQQPIVERHRTLVATDGAMSVTEAANVVGVSRGDLYRFLRDRDHREPWIYLRPGSDVERPFKDRCRRGELKVRLVRIQRSNGKTERIPQTLITPLGIDLILQQYPAWAVEQARKAAQSSGKPPDLFDNEG